MTASSLKEGSKVPKFTSSFEDEISAIASLLQQLILEFSAVIIINHFHYICDKSNFEIHWLSY